MLVVYRTVRSLSGGCIYKCLDVMAVRVYSRHQTRTAMNGMNTKFKIMK